MGINIMGNNSYAAYLATVRAHVIIHILTLQVICRMATRTTEMKSHLTDEVRE